MILLIHRDTVKAGCEAAYKTIEKDAARCCAELNCTHAHAAIEALNGTRQVWWLNQFASDEDKQRVADGFAGNEPLMAALGGIRQRRQDVIEHDFEVWATYRADLSGAPLAIAGARFFAVVVTNGDPPIPGAVFETAEGQRYVFRSTAMRDEAYRIAAAAGPHATIFAVRPYWGMPAAEWIGADPEFWKQSPKYARLA